MQRLHRVLVIVLTAGSLLAALSIAAPTMARAAPSAAEASALTVTTPAGPGGPVTRIRADVPAAAPGGSWRPPIGPIDVETRFDPPPLPWMPGHRGVDLGAAADGSVRAAGAGTVVFAGDLAGRGVVSIDHAGGLRTTYEPVDALVAPGDAVAAGKVIGRLQAGHASCPGAICLHLGLKRGPLYLDPLLLFGQGQVRLLPRPGRAEAAP